MVKFFLIVVFIYLCLIAVLYFFQRNILFVPSRSKPILSESLVPEMTEVILATEDDLKLVSWFHRGEADKQLIIYFQGNAGNIGNRDYKARFFINSGYSVLLVGYRGYGGNPGKPSEVGLTRDAEAALNFAQSEAFSNEDIVLYGESLGTGVAVNLAQSKEFHALVLEAPYTSIERIASKRYWFVPVRYLLKDKFDTINKAKQLQSPTLLLHGDADRVIPISYGKQLFEQLNNPKEFAVFHGGGHSDLFDYGAGEKVDKFLSKPPRLN